MDKKENYQHSSVLYYHVHRICVAYNAVNIREVLQLE